MSLSLEGHTARAFDGDLSSLHIQAVAMGALVIEQVQLAVNAYSNWDRVDRDAGAGARAQDQSLRRGDRRGRAAGDRAGGSRSRRICAPCSPSTRWSPNSSAPRTRPRNSRSPCWRIRTPTVFGPAPPPRAKRASSGVSPSQMIRAALEAFDRLDPAAAAAVMQPGPGNGFRICRGAAAHSHARHGRCAPAAVGHRGGFHHAFAGAHRRPRAQYRAPRGFHRRGIRSAGDGVFSDKFAASTNRQPDEHR